MGTTTPILGLYQPDNAETGWGDEVNANLDVLENRITLEHVNVMDYGAVGDGSTDDTVAVQAAMDAADGAGPRVVYAPAGSYKITDTLNTASRVTIQGSGPLTRFLHCAGSDPLFKLIPNQQHTKFRDFMISGPNDDTSPMGTGTGHGIQIAGVAGGSGYITQTHINHIKFNGVGDATHYAIHAFWAIETFISECMITRCEGGGIYMGSTSNASHIQNVTASNGGSGALSGVHLDDVTGVTLTSNVWESWRGTEATRITGGGGHVLVNQWWEDNSNADLVIEGTASDGCTGITVINCAAPAAATISKACKGILFINCTTLGATITSDSGANEDSQVMFLGRNIGPNIDTSGMTNAQDRVFFFDSRPGSANPDAITDVDGLYLLAPAGGGGGRLKLDQGMLEFSERAGSLAGDGYRPVDGSVRLYARSAGGGKTQLVAEFQSGAEQVVALEP